MEIKAIIIQIIMMDKIVTIKTKETTTKNNQIIIKMKIKPIIIMVKLIVIIDLQQKAQLKLQVQQQMEQKRIIQVHQQMK